MLDKLKELRALLDASEGYISPKASDLLDQVIEELEQKDKPLAVLTKLIQTCEAMPSQWDAWDSEGNQYYIRYRGAMGRVEKNKETIKTWYGDDPFDGYITQEDMLKVTGLKYEPKTEA